MGVLSGSLLALGHETVCFVSLGLGALVLSLCVFFVCEELAVILVGGGGCGASAHPCEASASGLLSLGSSHPSTGAVGGGAGPGLTRSCSPGHITASDLVPSPWALLPRLSPAIRLPPMGWLGWGVCVCLHVLKCCLLFPGNIGSHFFGISRFFCGNV